MRKYVSWAIVLAVGVVVGYVARGAMDGGGRPPPAAAPAAQRPARPVEDPKAVYRVPLDGSPVKGPADALVTIVESSDFECPFCKRVVPTLKQIEEAYRGKVRFVFKHNPLPFHARAMPAALAAEEARRQGGDEKFWAMHDALLAQPSLDAAAIEKAAADAGLDVAKVKEAVAAGDGKDRVERDQKLVQAVGAPSTPCFFINGRKVPGAQRLEVFRAVIDDELNKAEALVKAGTPPAQVYARIQERAASAPVFLPGGVPAPAQGQPQAAAAAAPAIAAAALPPAALQIRTDDPVRGNPKAPVTIVLFSDFQCPFCARVGPTLEEAQRTFGDKLRVVWKHQPLSFHAQALPAAEAAEAAREQGKFWPMHDRLFAGQRELSPESYERIARDIGLDVGRFQEAVRSGKARARIAEDQRLAQAVGASGTPTMFVNGEKVAGAVPFATLKAVIDRKLSAP